MEGPTLAEGPMHPATLILLLAAAVSAPAERPPLAERSDGSWAVLEAMHEEPPPLALVTDGLLIDEQEWAEAQAGAEAVARAEAEAAARRAFEEAVDAARREPQS